jgi:hypothetical protein
MRHIGDGDDEPVAVAVRFGVDGVVEIARVVAVDRDQRQAAQVDAALFFRLGDFRFDARDIAQHDGWPFVGQVVAGDRHLDDERRRQAFAEHGEDAAHRPALRGRRIGDLGDDDLAGARAAILARRDQDVLMQTAVVRRDENEAVLLDHAPDQPRRAPFEHFDDRALRGRDGRRRPRSRARDRRAVPCAFRRARDRGLRRPHRDAGNRSLPSWR